MHRADLHADFPRIDLFEDRFNDLEEDPGARLDFAAIVVGAAVGGAVQELRKKVEVVRLDLHAVEPCNHRVARGTGIVVDGVSDFVPCHRTRRDGGNAARGGD